MKFRTKLYLFFLAISLLSMVSSLTIVIIQSRKAIFARLQSEIIVVAAGAAIGIDGDKIKEIKTEADQTTQVYKDLADTLRRHRDANRRKELYVKFLYITKPDPANPEKFIFVVDPEEKKEDFSPVGQENTGASKDKLKDHLKEPYSFGQLTQDQWGIWLTGYYPIFDSKGQYVASIGGDVSAENVHKQLNRLLVVAIGSFVFSLFLSMFAATFLSRHAARALETLDDATVEIAKPNFEYRVTLDTDDEFEDLAKALNQMCGELQEKEKLKAGFSHYVSKHVLERIVKEKGVTKLEGEKRKITVLFADIRGFTHIAEQMPPEEVVKLLNEYFKVMLEIIFKHNGMLDKFIGDGIMAEFGVPIDDPAQERNAISAAIEMYQHLALLRQKWKSEGKPDLDIGIGIHTGEAIVGSIGTEDRMEFTAIGDTVNIASRVQNITKDAHFPILVTESTFKNIRNEFPYKELGPMTLTGRDQPINVYAILHPGFDAGKAQLPS
ncbi:MAG: HAMP domain-containing protein [Parachlamydiales bacterium]|nr:HAMP domain-containing protein [Parachlamydiales bacterium]